MSFFGICFLLYFFKLSAGHGLILKSVKIIQFHQGFTENHSKFTTKIAYDLSTFNIKENMFAFYRLIFNMKIHRWKGSNEYFNDILKISGGFSCYS